MVKRKKYINFANRKIKKLAIHLPPEGRGFLARCLIKDCDNILKEQNLYNDKIFIDAVLSNKTLWEEIKKKREEL